jgi:hypothetical protein
MFGLCITTGFLILFLLSTSIRPRSELMETLHTTLSVGGPLVTLIGVAVSVLGTYLLTKKYHPWTPGDYLRHLSDSPFFAMALLERKHDAIRSESLSQPSESDRKLEELRLIARAGEVNPERGSVSLVGIDMIFIGFVLQAIGAVFSLADVAWTHISAGC